MYVINPRILKLLESGEFSDMPTLLEKVKGKNDKVIIYKLKEYWLDIGTKESYHQAYKYLD